MSKLLDGIHIFENKKEVILRITKFCNQKCLFCFTDIDNKTEILYEDIVMEIDDLISNNKGSVLDFVITGGEPSMHKDFLNIIDYIYFKGHHITIQSNMVTLGNNNIYIDILSKYKDKISFFISFHSHLEKVYDAITNTKNQYFLAKKGIKLLASSFDNITINIVLNAFNIKFLKDYFDFIGNEFYLINKSIKLNLSVMSNVYKYNYVDKLLVKYSYIVIIINNSQEIINKYGINIGADFGGPCDLPFCIGKKLFYYAERISYNRE